MTGLWRRAVLAGTATVTMLGAGTAASALTRTTPAAAVAGTLTAVSCASASNCIAVGHRSATSTSGATTLAEKWNGTKWSVVTSANPSGSTSAELLGVACTAAKSCMAVGEYFASGSGLPLAETWNGSKWSLVAAPAPSGSTGAGLEAIACTSATSCQGVGSSMDDTLAENWNGTAWSIVSSPSPNPAKPNVLSGVSCASASLCWAVGYDFPTNYSGSLTEKWNGKKWSVVSTPNSKSGELIGDDCASSTACLAVGINNKLFAIAQSWAGTKWVTAAPAKPKGTASSELNGVSCATTSACESVGNYYNSTVTATLGESWNGTKWAVQTMPSVSGSSYASLGGVSCVTSSDCWAAGTSFASSSGAASPLLEQWNGTSWSQS
jgi:hypothetical protein